MEQRSLYASQSAMTAQLEICVMQKHGSVDKFPKKKKAPIPHHTIVLESLRETMENY